ncbi:LOW QUALITY PROTEIN: ASI1-immunoprecipitated protein 2-like [Phragmites australis]|uniref:LOW QUALITY PROTEIN: ASI1-immunoprecipitated protein 2-like n=1 Tax=Phragmites australis TaxID=29695 RepID=UPI002D77698D|nr:LOW QUALITY PROTEIN: ASI1-immunoprecipitated protein 2-like [Phragmites australis]
MQRCRDDLVCDVQDSMTSSEDRSSEVLEDVKVCDICGDVGEEEKLAVCSRCNDGAEHIYCMQVMIQDVPEGEWFCEACRAEVDMEKKKNKLEISQVKAGTFSSENKAVAEHVGNKESNKACQCNVGCVTSGLTSTIKVEDGSSRIGGSEAVNEDKACRDCEPISSERSTAFNLKSLDGETHILESFNYDVSCDFEVKDTSSVAVMNERIKIQSEEKICDICGDVGEEKKLAVCSRCNNGAEHIYCMRVMVQEVPDVGWLCEACQSEVEIERKNNKLEKSQVKIGASKGQSTEGKLNKPASDANIRSSFKNEVEVMYAGSKSQKKRNHDNCPATQRKEAEACVTSLIRQNLPEPGGVSIEAGSRKRVLSRGSSFKFDTEKGKHAIGQVPTSLASNAMRNKAQLLHGPLSKSVSFNNSKIPKVKQLGSEVPLKPKHLKEPSSCIRKQVGPMNILATSTSFIKPNFGDPATKAKAPTKPLAEETRVMNPPMSRNVKNNRGTSIFGCPSVSASLAAPISSLAESAGQHLTKGNNMVESNYLSFIHGQDSQNLGHSEQKKPHIAKTPGSITLSGVERSAGIFGPDAQRKAVQIPYPSHQDNKLNNPCPKLEVKDYDPICTIRTSVDSPTISDLGVKTLAFSSQDFSPGYEQIASTAPELNYVWQGGFELWRTGQLPELCDGLQAHISCSASPKLLEVAKKFPSKIKLEKLPRQSIWPSQFQENCPAHDSIGLFFFARDTQSYENYYSKLVESIMKDDLALRGNIETAELLIFASSTLPKNFQRWNMFYFLWGVFRVRREDLLNLPPGVPKLAFSAHQDKLLASSDANGEVTFDVSTPSVPCSDSTVHEKGEESTTISLNDAEDLMDVDYVNTTEVIPGTAKHNSYISDGAQKRNVEMEN